MDDRRQDRGRDERYGRGQDDDYGSGRSVATQQRTGQGSEPARWEGGGEQGASGSGDWQGYIVPYRYYGPGYRGVGYYSVMYQGPGGNGEGQGQGEAAGQSGQGRWEDEQTSYGRSGEGSGRYDQMRSGEGSGPNDYWQSGFGRSGYGDRWGSGQRGYGQGRTGQGGFAGRGPKGYQRSDERIREEVSDRLMEHDHIDAGEIEVQVKDGEVTLSGTVPDRWMKRLAEDIAEQVMGVREVLNQVRIQSQSGMEGSSSSMGSSGSTRSGGSTSSRSTTSSRSRSAGRTKQSSTAESTSSNGTREPAGSGTR